MRKEIGYLIGVLILCVVSGLAGYGQAQPVQSSSSPQDYIDNGEMIPAGKYIITEPLQAPEGLWGAGKDRTIFQLADGANCDVIEMCPEDITFSPALSGFTVNGNKENNEEGSGIVWNENVRQLDLWLVKVINAPEIGIHGYYAPQSMDKVLVGFSGERGILFENGGGDITKSKSHDNGKQNWHLSGVEYRISGLTSSKGNNEGMRLSGFNRSTMAVSYIDQAALSGLVIRNSKDSIIQVIATRSNQRQRREQAQIILIDCQRMTIMMSVATNASYAVNPGFADYGIWEVGNCEGNIIKDNMTEDNLVQGVRRVD